VWLSVHLCSNLESSSPKAFSSNSLPSFTD
jgi:hypothetical protein